MGRGFVQITGRRICADWSKRLGVDLLKEPQLAEQPAIASQIIVEGMLLGAFTGKKLSDYITLKRSDFVNAGRIVNGMDRAELIAGYAREFDALPKADGRQRDACRVLGRLRRKLCEACATGVFRRSVKNAKSLILLVGVAGFEPATPSSRTMCATRLRYTP
jgi:hypothetical protein